MPDLAATRTGDRDAENLQADARELINRLFVCVKLAFVFDIGNAALGPPTEKLAETANRIRETTDGVAALQFLSDGVYANRTLVKVDAATLDQATYLFGIWTRLGIGEIAAIAETGASDWLDFLAAFKRAVGPGGDLASLKTVAFEKIRLRELQASGTSASSMQVTERFRALRAYGVATILLGEQVTRIQNGKRLQAAKIKRGVQELLSLEGSETLLLSLVGLKRHKRTHEHHLANTVVLSLLVGRRLGLDRNALCELGMQAAFHDIGDARLRASPLHERSGSARDAATETVRLLLRADMGGFAAMRSVVANELVQTFEPAARTEEEPYPFVPGAAARIIAVAHEYDALSSPRASQPALPADEALRALQAEAGRRFDPTITRLFATTVGIHPLGSLVALSTGETAIVVEASADPALAARPRIKIIRDAEGQLLDGVLVDLADEPHGGRHILGCLDEEEEDLNPLPFLLS